MVDGPQGCEEYVEAVDHFIRSLILHLMAVLAVSVADLGRAGSGTGPCISGKPLALSPLLDGPDGAKLHRHASSA